VQESGSAVDEEALNEVKKDLSSIRRQLHESFAVENQLVVCLVCQ